MTKEMKEVIDITYREMIKSIPKNISMKEFYKNKDYSFMKDNLRRIITVSKENYVKIVDEKIYYLISIPETHDNIFSWPGTVDNEGHYYEEFYVYYENDVPVSILFNLQEDFIIFVEESHRNKGIAKKFVETLYENFDNIEEKNEEKKNEYLKMRSKLPKKVSCLSDHSFKVLSSCKYIKAHERTYFDEIKEIENNKRKLIKKINISMNNIKHIQDLIKENVYETRKAISNRI